MCPDQGGGAGNRTRVQGFAGPCLNHSATPPGPAKLANRNRRAVSVAGVRFRVDNLIHLSRETVEEAFVDPAFYDTLGEMPNIKAPDLLEREEDGDQVLLRFRYAFSGDLPPAARRVLDPGRMTWIHEETIFRQEHRSEFEMIPEYYKNKMTCSGGYRLEDMGGDTNQRLEGDLIIRYPLVGRLVELAIVSGLRQNLAQEARLLERSRG